MLAISVWELAHLLAHAAPGPIETGFERLRWTAVSVVAFAWLAFVLDYTGRDDLLTRRGLAVLFAWPAALIALVIIYEHGNLLYYSGPEDRYQNYSPRRSC